MVPVELSLSNFLSYGEEAQTLDFSRFHVACLSGKNGQGKSALLDAMTWVLWGEARKSSGGHKPDDELIRIGSRRMKVEFLFDAEGQRYRVLRAYSRSATGKTSKVELELQLLEEGSDEGRPMTGASIRETQQHLNNVLGLDYHTFINSAFLLQGRSDEFTKKRPGDRKDILGRILNLSKYDRLANMARERQRHMTAEIEALDRDIERLGVSLTGEEEWQTEIDALLVRLEEMQKAIEEVRTRESVITERMGALEAQAKELEALDAQVARLKALRVEQNEKLMR